MASINHGTPSPPFRLVPSGWRACSGSHTGTAYFPPPVPSDGSLSAVHPNFTTILHTYRNSQTRTTSTNTEREKPSDLDKHHWSPCHVTLSAHSTSYSHSLILSIVFCFSIPFFHFCLCIFRLQSWNVESFILFHFLLGFPLPRSLKASPFQSPSAFAATFGPPLIQQHYFFSSKQSFDDFIWARASLGFFSLSHIIFFVPSSGS